MATPYSPPYSKTYTGLVIGGPYDGQNRVSETAWWQYSKLLDIPFYKLPLPGKGTTAVDQAIGAGEYRFFELDRHGFWLDDELRRTDEARGLDYVQTILNRLITNYRPVLTA